MAADDERVMISAIEHYAYCPRQCALIHVEQVFDENVFTLQGMALHERAHEAFTTLEEGKRIERAVPLWSEVLCLIGKADTVEFLADGCVRPVEYKRGARAARAHDDLQLCAQALCLEEMLGVPVTTGAIFYHASRRTREVVFDDKLRAATEAIAQVRDLLRTGRIPAGERRALPRLLAPSFLPASGARRCGRPGRRRSSPRRATRRWKSDPAMSQHALRAVARGSRPA